MEVSYLHPVYTEPTECQDCYKCIRECPVKAIKMKDGSAYIVSEECIICGKCVNICPVGAKKTRNDLEKAINLIQKKEKVIVSLAPSYIAEFSDIPKDNLIFILKKLGVYGVSETAIGAEEVSANVAKYMNKQKEQKIFISTACPTIVEYIKKYYYEYTKYLVPFLSPVLTHCRILREKYGNEIGIIFVGPCIAKKKEADEHPELLDVALTFEELRTWIKIKKMENLKHSKINEEKFIPYSAQEGRLYPIDGGMINTIKQNCNINDRQFMAFSGIKEFSDIIRNIEKLSLQESLFLELLACEGGCINGPKTNKNHGIVIKRYEVIKNTRIEKETIPDIPKYNVEESIRSTPVKTILVDEEDIIKALRKIGKYSSEDELNCGGCGYNSCRDFAQALVIGKTEPEMCVSYMRRLAQKKTNLLLKTMPCGVVIIDEELKVIEANRKFAELLEEEDFYDSVGIEGMKLNELTDFYDIFEEVLKTGRENLEKDIKSTGKTFRLLIFTIEPHRYVGGIIQDITDPLVQKEQVIEKAKKVIDKNLNTIQQVAYLLGETAAETELTLNSLIENFSPEEMDEKNEK